MAVARHIPTNGIELSTSDAGTGRPIVLCHGFPETGHSWRHQIAPLVDAGYRVVVPDLRGYGQSSVPYPAEAYDLRELTGDLVGLLDALDEPSAVFVGHDWGAQLVWWMAQLHPSRVDGVAALSVPFTPRPSTPPLARLRQWAGDRFFYIDYFQSEGVAEHELESDVRGFLLAMYSTLSGGEGPDPSLRSLPREGSVFRDQLTFPSRLPGWLTQADLEHYVEAFTRTGFRGALNWYRNFDRNWQLAPELGQRRVELPAVFIAGDRDPVLAFTPTRHLETWVPGLREHVIVPGAGHWIQQERPTEVTRILLRFFAALPPHQR